MKLWLLKPLVDGAFALELVRFPYDLYEGFVIRAETEDEARALAHQQTLGNEGEISGVWLDRTQTDCIELTPHGDPCVILSDYHYG